MNFFSIVFILLVSWFFTGSFAGFKRKDIFLFWKKNKRNIDIIVFYWTTCIVLFITFQGFHIWQNSKALGQEVFRLSEMVDSAFKEEDYSGFSTLLSRLKSARDKLEESSPYIVEIASGTSNVQKTVQKNLEIVEQEEQNARYFSDAKLALSTAVRQDKFSSNEEIERFIVSMQGAVDILKKIPTESLLYSGSQKILEDAEERLNYFVELLAWEKSNQSQYDTIVEAADLLVVATRDNILSLREIQSILDVHSKLITMLQERLDPDSMTYELFKTRLSSYLKDKVELEKIIKKEEEEQRNCPIAPGQCPSVLSFRFSTFEDSKELYLSPSRSSSRMGCLCPYDLREDGSVCGSSSAYSQPGGDAPRCYTSKPMAR
ncbi:MAG: hypothetical protein MH825_01115 [Cyanobacteria bacterium]|nr:hypothetical protein [Cyanobacteriota bacterium]